MTSKLKPITIIFIACCALILAVLAMIYLNPKPEKTAVPAASKPALTVSTAMPTQQNWPLKLSANGSIAPWQEAIIGSESNGLRLLQVLVNVGDRVQAGQLLAVFATESTQADTAQARASLLEAQATAMEAADTAARARTLDQSGALSAQQIRQYNTAEQTAKARVEAAQAMLDAQQLRGRQTRVIAPDDGIISARSATVGAVVGAGTELFRLIRGGRLEWRAEVTSAELGRVKIGTPVTVLAANGAPLTGRVRMVAPTIDPQTRTALVYVDLPASSKTASAGVAIAGMFAQGEFALGNRLALTVVQSALVVRDGFSYVFTVTPETGDEARVKQVKVETGRLSGERIEVIRGLAADQRVVVSGAGFLNDGDLVRINDSATVAAPAAAASSASSAPVVTP